MKKQKKKKCQSCKTQSYQSTWNKSTRCDTCELSYRKINK